MILALKDHCRPLLGWLGGRLALEQENQGFSSCCASHQPLDMGQNHFSSLSFCVLIYKVGTVS